MHSISRREFLAASTALAVVPALLSADETAPPSDVAWLDEIQMPPDELPADATTLSPLLVDADGRPIETLDAWRLRREELRQTWLDFLGPLAEKRPTPRLQILEEDRRDGCLRQLVRYESEPGLPVEGYLLRPLDVSSPAPGVVALHSTVDFTIRQPAGLEGQPEDFFGLKLAQRGAVAFCPRCFLWQGEGSYDERVADFARRHPGSLGMAKMLYDAQRGLDVLESLPEVDPARLGAVGHSLGAKEALYLAAFDERVQATVSSEGGIGTKFSNWNAPWYLGAGIDGLDDEGGENEGDGSLRFDREHHELLALIAPRPFLLLGGDSADGARSWPFIAAALPVYELFGRPARLGLFNHRAGHSVPPEAEARIYEWLDTYLAHRAE